MTGRTLILGYGSDLRGDDALGRTAAHILCARVHDPCVSVLSRPSLTPELAHDVSRVDRVIFVDCDARLPAGRIERRAVRPSPDADAMVHFLDPPGLLGWTRWLFGVSPCGVLFAMGGQTFACADALSPVVRGAMAELVERVLAEVRTPIRQPELRHA